MVRRARNRLKEENKVSKDEGTGQKMTKTAPRLKLSYRQQ